MYICKYIYKKNIESIFDQVFIGKTLVGAADVHFGVNGPHQ